MEFTLEEYFPVTPDRLYAAWLDSDEHSDMTGGNALITDEVGEPFNAWDGYIWGKNLELRPFFYIKQSWRSADFLDEQENSILELFFEPQGQGTKLLLKHSNLTEADEHYIKGWVESYFVPMKEYFEDIE